MKEELENTNKTTLIIGIVLACLTLPPSLMILFSFWWRWVEFSVELLSKTIS